MRIKSAARRGVTLAGTWTIASILGGCASQTPGDAGKVAAAQPATARPRCSLAAPHLNGGIAVLGAPPIFAAAAIGSAIGQAFEAGADYRACRQTAAAQAAAPAPAAPPVKLAQASPPAAQPTTPAATAQPASPAPLTATQPTMLLPRNAMSLFSGVLPGASTRPISAPGTVPPGELAGVRDASPFR